MSKTKIKTDCHGMYVRTGGYVFRPQESTSSYPTAKTLKQTVTVYSHGMEVKVRHIGGTPYCEIRMPADNRINEHWHGHGSYLEGTRTLHSHECWHPKDETVV